MKRLSRREFAAAVAAAPPAVMAQAPAAAATDPAAAVREANRRNAETLAKFELPMATEPAFQFKP